MSLLKDKRALYVLLPLVVLIWSAVGWQVYQGVAGSNEYTPLTFELKESTELSVDTFYLKGGYADPFKVKRSIARSATGTTAPRQTSKPKNKKPIKTTLPTVVWPPIEYLGEINNVSSGKKTAILRVSGRTLTLEQGNQVQDITVLKCYSDSVVLRFSEQNRTIKKLK